VARYLRQLQLTLNNGEELLQKITSLALPFSVLAENRKEPFTEDMEKAALYCFAEMERGKGGGLILKKPEEKTVFLAKFCYPFWLAPWNGLSLVFDGLKQSAHTLAYKGIPDVKTFIESAHRSSKSMETYMAFLSDNVNYFQAPSEEKTVILEALITDPASLSEFNQCFSEVKPLETSESEIVLLSPLVDEATVLSAIEELKKLKSAFEAEVNSLNESMKLLNKTTRILVKELRGKMRAVMEEFEEEIRKEEEAVTRKVSRINEEYDEQRVKLMKNFEKQLLALQKEKVKFEKTRAQMLEKIEQYNIEAKTCAANKDSIGERKWKEKINETKKELSEIEKRLEETEDRIREVEESRSAETFKLRSEWESRIKEARMDLLELEASRDAKIQIHKQETEKLESLTANIIQQISNVIKLRETDLANFNNLGFPQKNKHLNLVYMPFYLACYEAEMKKRYVVFPPSIANSIGFTTKLKGALGKAKVKHLLVPRFKAITSLLEGLPVLTEKNAAFAREIFEAGGKADILKSKSKWKSVENGLEKLKAEGWLSDKEFEALSQKTA
jgi:hypothetical protein